MRLVRVVNEVGGLDVRTPEKPFLLFPFRRGAAEREEEKEKGWGRSRGPSNQPSSPRGQAAWGRGNLEVLKFECEV